MPLHALRRSVAFLSSRTAPAHANPSCVLILLRDTFRTMEFGEGSNQTGYFLSNEAWCPSFPL